MVLPCSILHCFDSTHVNQCCNDGRQGYAHFHPTSEEHATKILQTAGQDVFMARDPLSILRNDGHIVQIGTRMNKQDLSLSSRAAAQRTRLLSYMRSDA